MLIAGEPSGDWLAADLVGTLRDQLGNRPVRFYGAGGERMMAAGVELSLDLTRHSVIGLSEVLRNYAKFRRFFHMLLRQAIHEKPDVVIGIDFGGFNLRFAQAIRKAASKIPEWSPRIIQYVSPQVWASRAGRAKTLETTHDLLLCILPFEPAWYAQHAPGLAVEFVGHPIVDRHSAESPTSSRTSAEGEAPRGNVVLLLPGSRAGELKRHLPVLLPAARRLREEAGATIRMVIPNEHLRAVAELISGDLTGVDVQVGGLENALRIATVAIASTGTVTLECAWFGVPTVALYKTSWTTYQIGRRIVQVRWLAMPNLLANDSVIPEFIQDEATADHLAQAALELLQDPNRRMQIQKQLRTVVASLGSPGAAVRASAAILRTVLGHNPTRIESRYDRIE
ncbi:MAG: lipid-A-disaccharide synthase [Pedosphaera sp.]|nr:lipid-A-disaccharide synthase [Pedosphaera sp.]